MSLDKDEQLYCVAACDRNDNMRKAITNGSSYQQAFNFKQVYSKNKSWKKMYKYFHVAKFPYKPKPHGG